MDNVREMGKFLQITSSKTEQKEIENMSKPITSKEVESVTQKKKKKPKLSAQRPVIAQTIKFLKKHYHFGKWRTVRKK
ncbi:hypothetical protein DSQ37_03885 [Ureaplasma urealyticum]|nr:hypothetical protein DSQ37_03885 [Ureaplasma urealyticum]